MAAALLATGAILSSGAAPSAGQATTAPTARGSRDTRYSATRWVPERLTVARRTVTLGRDVRVAFSDPSLMLGWNLTMAVFEGGCRVVRKVSISPTLITLLDPPKAATACTDELSRRFAAATRRLAYRRSASDRVDVTLPGATLRLRMLVEPEMPGTYSLVPERSTARLPEREVEIWLDGARYGASDGCHSLRGEYVLTPDREDVARWQLHTFGATTMTANACPGSATVAFDGATIERTGLMTVQVADGTYYALQRRSNG